MPRLIPADASFRDSLPRQVRAPAVFKCVRVTSIEDGEDELTAVVRERLAAYKVPKEVHVVEDLPKTQTGKIRRAALRD